MLVVVISCDAFIVEVVGEIVDCIVCVYLS